MTQEFRYYVSIDADEDVDPERMENAVQRVLSDLYDDESVETITVVDKSGPHDDAADRIVEVLDEIKSKDVRRAIEAALELQREEEDDE